jgi:hypothetical protein
MATFGGAQPIVTDGLVFAVDAANYQSYPGSGTTWSDLSGNGNNGTLVNGPTYDGMNGGNIIFDGSDDRVDFNNFQLSTTDSTQPYSILFFFKRNGGTSDGGILTQYSGNTGISTRFGIRENGSKLSWWKGGVHRLVSSQNININQWYYVCFIKYNNGDLNLYINNVLDNSSTDPLVFENYNFMIGRFNNIVPFNGSIPLVLIYNRVLTSSEITQNYNALKGRFGL